MSRADCVGPVLGGLGIVAVLVLAGCQEAPTPTAEPSIEGEWRVTEYLHWLYRKPAGSDEEQLIQEDLTVRHTIHLSLVDGYVRWTFDPPYFDIRINRGKYELLADSRILLEYPTFSIVARYELDADKLMLRMLTIGNREDVLIARRM